MVLVRYAWRELRNSPRFCVLFIINLSLGLVGFIGLDTLKRSFSDRLDASARQMLTADLAISSRRPFEATVLKDAESSLPPGTESQELLTLYSMVASTGRSALVELRAIEDRYPFYGTIQLEKRGLFAGSDKLPLENEVWVAPELLIQLDTKIGSELKVGQRDFKISDVIVDESSAALVGTAMAPRVYISRKDLEASGLVQFGSTVFRTKLFRLPPQIDPEQAKISLGQAIKDASIRVRSFKEAGQDDGRLLAYLSDYLGLVSLVALALAAIGATYLFRVYIDRKQHAIATLVSLGMTHQRAAWLYLLQLAILGAASALLACVLSLGTLPLAVRLLAQLSPIALTLGVSWPSYALALLLGIGGAVVVCLPLLARILTLNPSTLFSEQGNAALSERSSFISYLPSLITFYGLAVWQAHSIKVGSIFVGVLAVVITVFVAIALLLMKIARSMKQGRSLSTRLAITYLNSNPTHTISCFVALGVGATLINLIPQIQHSIQSELQQPEGDRLPSLFMFDIQEDQVDALQTYLKIKNLDAGTLSPMIMSRLTAINGEAYVREGDEGLTREAEQEQRSRNRGVNLSYRSQLAAGENVVRGHFFNSRFEPTTQGLAELSLEEKYAERMGVKLGDRLTFDVQGLPIDGRITSFRSVKWNTFQPNFFILIQPGAIDDAPKTFLMSLPAMNADRQAHIQKEIVDQFPNISIIDVSRLVSEITELVKQMSLVLIVMGWLTVLTGNVVVISIAHQQALSRRWDHNLLKVLGAEFKLIMRATLLEFAWLGGAAAILGSCLGIFASFILARGVFRGLWQPTLDIPSYLALLLLSVCLISAFFATRRILAQKPSLQLDEG